VSRGSSDWRGRIDTTDRLKRKLLKLLYKQEILMKSLSRKITAILLSATFISGGPVLAEPTKIDSRIGELEFTKDFENGYPTDETVKKLYDEMDFQRATQAYMWSIPLIGFVYWQIHQADELGLKNGQLLYMETYDEKVCCLTLNATTPYVTGFVDLQELGPYVIEVPPGDQVRGAVSDMWQIQVTQMTRPGKYLFVGPYQEVPAGAESEGYIINHSPMNNFFVGIRLMPEGEKARLALLNQIKIYPFSERKKPKKMDHIRPKKEWYAHQPRSMDYWKALHTSINREPVREMDRYYMAMLKKLGIEKGKPFKPDARQKKILTDALVVGEAMAKANDFSKRLDKAHYRDGSHWDFATTANWNSRTEYYQELDGSAAWFYKAVTNDESMHGQETGWGQVYMGANKDADGDWLDGATNYVLHVPAKPPAKTFWSMTLYDVSTRAIIKNKTKKADLSSVQKLQMNKDGSVDLYFGPKAPAGKESNWVQTMPDKAWFPYFRLYSPTQPFLDQTWVLPDIEKADK
jgi:hypothetical protein